MACTSSDQNGSESRRIDNQPWPFGTPGRPGESRFYLSLGDDLMRLFKSDIVEWVLQALKMPDDVPIENKRVTPRLPAHRAKLRRKTSRSCKNILKYDDVMNRQRMRSTATVARFWRAPTSNRGCVPPSTQSSSNTS